jgi:outer membrane receptor protein involved in Fe transport
VQFIPPATLTAAGYGTDQTPGLPGYTSLDLVASRDIGKGFQVFAGAQNLMDTVYFVQTNPSTVGTPRLITAGFSVKFSGR